MCVCLIPNKCVYPFLGRCPNCHFLFDAAKVRQQKESASKNLPKFSKKPHFLDFTQSMLSRTLNFPYFSPQFRKMENRRFETGKQRVE